jgi:adenosylhomocysteine nucleosidase
MIGIIVALKSETPQIEKTSSYVKEYEINGFNVVLLKILGEFVPLVYSGVGKTNASAATQLLIDHFKVNLIFNIGSCGAIINGINIGDLIMPKSLSYYDVDVEAFGYKLNQIPHEPELFYMDDRIVNKIEPILQMHKKTLHKVNIATGETFITNKNIGKYSMQNIAAVEMEATAICQICLKNKISFFTVKIVSDNILIEDKNEKQWNDNINSIGSLIIKIIEDVLHKLVWDKTK